jgi:hypothetical protein
MVLSPKSQIMQWGCLLIVSIIFLAGGGKYAFAVKATPPLNLSLTSRTLSDGQTELTLKAIANLTVDKADLTIVLPASLDLASGGLQWEGAIAIGEKKEVKVLVRTLANIQALVIGKATVYFTHGGSLLQQQTLLLNAPKKKASPPAKPPTLRKQGRDTILEFK